MKKHYVWDTRHEYWHEPGKVTGFKWVGDGWLSCWVEPEANAANCWFPKFAGQLMSFGHHWIKI